MEELTEQEAQEKDEHLRTVYGKGLQDIAEHLGALAANDREALVWFCFHLNNVMRGCLLMAERIEAGESLAQAYTTH